jgi:hypothetical protein
VATCWTAEQDALLGTMTDADLVEGIGRTEGAVRCRRTTRGIPTDAVHRRRG